MKKRIVSAMLMSCILSGNLFLTPAMAANQTDSNNQIRGEYLIMTENSAAMKRLEQRYDDSVVNNLEDNSLSDNGVLNLKLTYNQAKQISNEQGVTSVERNIKVYGCESDEQTDASKWTQWNLDAIGANSNQNAGKGVKIALIDSGVSATDDIDIIQRINFVPGEDEVSEQFEDASGHGTGLAGIIAAKDNQNGIRGIAPASELYSLKVLNNDNECSLDQLVSAIYWAKDHDMDIVNLSLGTEENSQILKQAIKDLNDSGTLVIAAAGNQNLDHMLYPAAYNGVLSVGASDETGKMPQGYVNDENTDIVAPGIKVPVTGLLDGITIADGSSISAAEVTGSAARVLSEYPESDADYIRELFKSTARKCDGNHTTGQLDVANALSNYNNFKQRYKNSSEKTLNLNSNEAEDFSDSNNGMVTGMWSTSTHGSLADHYASQIFTSNDYVRLAVACAKIPDTSYPVTSNTDPNSGDNVGFHGGGNYVANTRYLFYLAKNVLAEDISSKSASDAAYNQLMNLSGLHLSKKEKDFLDRLKKNTEQILTSNVLTDVSETNPKARYAKVLGLAMHVIGDTYAHRTIVPKYTVDGTNPSNPVFKPADDHKSRFGTSDFIFDNNHTKESDETLKEWASKASTSSICKYWNCFQRSVGLGVMEFRDIKYYMKTKSASRYEDKTSFCHERYTDTKVCLNRFMTRSYNGEAFHCKIFWPNNENVLNQYKKYSQNAGSHVENIPDSEWQQVSN